MRRAGGADLIVLMRARAIDTAALRPVSPVDLALGIGRDWQKRNGLEERQPELGARSATSTLITSSCRLVAPGWTGRGHLPG